MNVQFESFINAKLQLASFYKQMLKQFAIRCLIISTYLPYKTVSNASHFPPVQSVYTRTMNERYFQIALGLSFDSKTDD